jgi:CRP-like cAMP-binding protein
MDYVSVFNCDRSGDGGNGDDLQLPHWTADQWRTLFAVTTARAFKTSEVLIQRGMADRVLYFVAAGSLEVGVTYMDGISISPIAKIGVGSIIGEQSFFDGKPRSANVWAVTDGEVLCLKHEQFRLFSEAEPGLARDLLFALGRVLSLRLRNTTVRIRR